jgi:hypothetical protein
MLNEIIRRETEKAKAAREELFDYLVGVAVSWARNRRGTCLSVAEIKERLSSIKLVSACDEGVRRRAEATVEIILDKLEAECESTTTTDGNQKRNTDGAPVAEKNAP